MEDEQPVQKDLREQPFTHHFLDKEINALKMKVMHTARYKQNRTEFVWLLQALYPPTTSTCSPT